MSRRAARRRIAVVTGTRAEYGLLRTVLRAMDRQAALETQLIVTGMHLLPRYGRTIRHIEADGFAIAARVRMQRGTDDPLDQTEGLARGVAGIGRELRRLGSDMVLVLGDRIEALAGALAGATQGVMVAHVHGGDVAPGDLDDSIRHAITKLAHVHLAATRGAARRIIRMGEDPRNVFTVGAPGLDELKPLMLSRPARSGPGRLIERRGQALVVQHAYGRTARRESAVMRGVLRGVEACGLDIVALHPNSDRGNAGVFEALRGFARGRRRARLTMHAALPRGAFIETLLASDVIVGNSSAGIIEAPFLGVPSVNVGLRQAGRERGGRSIIDVDETFAAVRDGVRRAFERSPRRGRSVYGEGEAGERIAEILASIPLELGRRPKRIRY